MQYRKEIDGLRALAILPVVFFHAGFSFFSGGYIGVDVFFVISGYLITSIILKQKSEGNFSILHFYERRIRRIFPALFVVMICCVPFAYLWMLPGSFIEFGQSLIATQTFTSNILFWLQSGYFDSAAEYKPLLHTWSLSVEEQYYMLFPLFIMLAWPLGKKFILGALILGVFISIGIAEWGWRNHTLANFFLTPTRVWELLIGVLAAFYLFQKDIKGNNALSIIGVGLIIFSIISFDKHTPFPSLYTLIPVIGTALIILFASPKTILGKLLCFKPIVGIGLISYSAYLWHQPLFAFARIRLEEEPSTLLYLILSVITFILAYFSWRFIENPIRHNKSWSQKTIFLAAFLSALFIISLGLYIYKTDGMKNRYAQENQYLVSLSSAQQRAYVPLTFYEHLNRDYNEDGGEKILIIGDSYAQDFTNALYEVGFLENKQLSTHVISAHCGNLNIDRDITQFIEPRNRTACKTEGWYQHGTLQDRIKQADVIFIASAWSKWVLDLLPESLDNIKSQTDAKVLIVGRKYFGPIKIKHYLTLTPQERVQLEQTSNDFHKSINEEMKEIIPQEYFLDLHQLACGDDYICPVFTLDGKLISYDGGHLTQDGAQYIGELLKKGNYF